MKPSMSPKSRFLAAMLGGPVDRVPVGNVVSCITVELMEKAGAFFPDAHLNAELMATLAATGHEVARVEHGGNVNAVTFSPDGQWLATGSADGTARVWEAATGKEIARMEHEGEVNAVTFSLDGRWVASGSADGTVWVWEAATGEEVARAEHEGGVRAVVFSPDGWWVASRSDPYNGIVKLWWRPKDLIAEACARVPRNLTLEEWRRYLGDEPYRKTCSNLPGPEGWEEIPAITPSPTSSPTASPIPLPVPSPVPRPRP